MNLAHSMQKFQDWFTQQWIILFGKKINPKEYGWLWGPFGEIDGIGEKFILQLAEKENLTVQRNCKNVGLLYSIDDLKLQNTEKEQLSKQVIKFYERTSEYRLNFTVKWNPFFKIFGVIINRLFSQRINQLNIPTSKISDSELLSNEIIKLIDNVSHEIKYTIWLRKIESSGQIIYSGVYGTCQLPNGETCIKAVFPLPKGNATVLLKPTVGNQNDLLLQSAGKKFNEPGFYFLLKDSKDQYWTQYHSTFTDELRIYETNNKLQAQQTLKLWNFTVATFYYEMSK